MAWYWWLLIGLGWLIFWALAIIFFMIIIESKYPIMGELTEVRRTKSILDKIPIPIIWIAIFLAGPIVLTYFWIKTRRTLIKENLLEQNEPLLTFKDFKYLYIGYINP